MLFAIGFLVTFLLRRADRRAPRPRRRWTSTSQRLVLRGGALPLRAVRHDRVRGVRRDLLLVPEVHRALPGRAAGQAALLADLHRLPHDLPGAALARRRGHAPPVRRLPAQRRLHHARTRSPRSARSCSASRRCRSCGTSTSRTSTARWSTADDPWGHGNSLEWATSCPPPRHNFDRHAAHPLRAAGVRGALPGAGRAAGAGGALGQRAGRAHATSPATRSGRGRARRTPTRADVASASHQWVSVTCGGRLIPLRNPCPS